MSEPERMGTGTPGERPTACPGAVLVVSPEEQRELEHAGVRFGARPEKGRARCGVRVRCADRLHTEDVTWGEGSPPQRVTYGLCHACSMLELRFRESRRQTQSKGDDRW